MSPEDPPQETAHRPRIHVWSRLVQLLVVVLIAVIGLCTVGAGQTDSAMVFVGLPTLLGLAIALSPPAKSLHGVTFRAVSLGLLIAAVLAREGILCVIMAAPLVYAIAHGVAAAYDLDHRRRTLAVVPLALVLGMEGVVPGLRVEPDQTVTVTHTVAFSPAVVAQRIAAGPDFSATGKPLLLAMAPLPGHVTGAGIEVADGWDFVFHGDNHGPGGELLCRVSAVQRDQNGGRVEFVVVSDTSVVHRWLTWTSAELSWAAGPTGSTVTLVLHFTRALDPSWYFGPIEQVMIGSAGDVILDSLGLAGA